MAHLWIQLIAIICVIYWITKCELRYVVDIEYILKQYECSTGYELGNNKSVIKGQVSLVGDVRAAPEYILLKRNSSKDIVQYSCIISGVSLSTQ